MSRETRDPRDLRDRDDEEPTPEGAAQAAEEIGAATIAETPEASEQLSIAARLKQPKTILSIVVPLILLVFVFQVALKIDIEQLKNGILHSNPLLLFAGLVIFYVGFPLRGLRWSMILRRTGFRITIRDSTEILFLSWLVNCLVPAKLGDIYRAYLLKINSTSSLSRNVGTVFIERILDLVVVALLGLVAGFVSFRSGMPPEVQAIFVVGVVLVVALTGGLLTLRSFGRRLLVRLPIPERFIDLYDRFEEGVFSAVGLRELPKLGLITVLTWGTEVARLYCVIAALGFTDFRLGISGTIFVALAASLLTAIPFTPAGIGIVEAGIIGLLTSLYGVPPTEAAAVALVDRAISVLSIIVLGAIVYVLSPKRRGAGLAEGSGELEPSTSTP